MSGRVRVLNNPNIRACHPSHSRSLHAVGRTVCLALCPSTRCNSRLCAKYECLVFANLLHCAGIGGQKISMYYLSLALSFRFVVRTNTFRYVQTNGRTNVCFVLCMHVQMQGTQLDLVNSFLFMLLLLFNGRQNHYKQCNTFQNVRGWIVSSGACFFSAVLLLLLLFHYIHAEDVIHTDGDSLHRYIVHWKFIVKSMLQFVNSFNLQHIKLADSWRMKRKMPPLNKCKWTYAIQEKTKMKFRNMLLIFKDSL